MQNVFLDTRTLDEDVRTRYGLSEDIMMENAASALRECVLNHLAEDRSLCINRPAVLILAGSGNNGADGYALARQLMSHRFAVCVCAVLEPKSPMCCLQAARAAKIGVRIIDAQELDAYLEEQSIDIKCMVDCIYGSGFHGELGFTESAVVMSCNNDIDAYKIACDVPTGLDKYGNGSLVFMADETVTMGALKLALLSDKAKDACGKVTVSFLGVSRDNFERGQHGEPMPDAYLLEEKDMQLPFRKKQNVNKGTFGHAVIAVGSKPGAGIMAGMSSLRFGTGLATLVGHFTGGMPKTLLSMPYELMTSASFPENTTAVAVGMGLGREHEDSLLYFGFLMQNKNIPAVLDADVFYNKDIVRLLSSRAKGLVLTPHPKEFLSLLTLCGLNKIGDDSIDTVEKCIAHRVELADIFCSAYPDAVLLIKGANTIIAVKNGVGAKTIFYINGLGTNALSKAGSGDVLSGMICSLLAQKYNPVKAAVTASLAHAKAACNACRDKHMFALVPQDIMQEICRL